LGWVAIEDMWMVIENRFATKKEMCDKCVLSFEEKLGYEIIIAKL